jgi:hypothetical protein
MSSSEQWTAYVDLLVEVRVQAPLPTKHIRYSMI